MDRNQNKNQSPLRPLPIHLKIFADIVKKKKKNWDIGNTTAWHFREKGREGGQLQARKEYSHQK